MKPGNERSRILRGIYEDNCSIKDFHGTLRRKASGRRALRLKRRFRRWVTPIVLLIALVGFSLPVLMRQKPAVPRVVNAGMAATAVTIVNAAAMPARVSANAPGQVVNVGEVKSLAIRDDIPLSQMLNLGIRRIVLDPGHGGNDPGTIGRRGTKEKDITLAIALKLREQLIVYGVADIQMTRTDDRYVSLQERMDFAKEAKADMFVSIHVNSLPNSPANIIETFYFGPSDDIRTLQLADRENMGSEYGLSDFMEIVERLGKAMKLQESRKLAEGIQKYLYRNGKELDPNVVDAGVKTAPFVVLMGLDVPSVLVEVACMSNVRAERDLNSAENQERIAAAITTGIMNYQNMGVIKNESGTLSR